MTLATAALGPAYSPGSWRTFFTLTGTAAATLTGAVLRRLLAARAGAAGQSGAQDAVTLPADLADRDHYRLGFVVMPGQSRAVLAAEILVVSVRCVAYAVWPVLRTVRSELPDVSADLAVRWLGMGVTWLLSIGAGISLLAGHGGGLFLLAFAQLLGIALLVAAAWTLVVEAGKHIRGKDIAPGREHRTELPDAGRLPSPAAKEDGSARWLPPPPLPPGLPGSPGLVSPCLL
jgi:hypothetical protein